ncbi:MAG: type VI secretion system baseplate subunit TssG [Deltaproteobacteria bacterium]|nr:type VI secretion system baseplate subunit TssG [Deltaproteobacteria bacterium]
MASSSRRTDPPLERVLFEEGHRFEFFQAVRVLERLFARLQPVGRDARPSEEVIRFRSRISLTFPPSAIYEITPPEDGTRPGEMLVNFMGLFGPLGVLPRHYTELLLERVRRKDFALRDFLDLFNHRMISLFYRAWEKYRFPIAYERSVSKKEDYDPFSLNLFDLVGMGTPGLRGKMKVGDEALLYYAGPVAQQPHSASALQAIIQDYFEAPMRIAQFTGQWLFLSVENRSRLGRANSNNALGLTAVLGSRFWDQQAKFRLRIGPISFAQFRRFIPSGDAFQPLIQLVRFFVGQTLDFDVQLILKAAEVPACRLEKPGAGGLRLGWSSWLKTRDFTHDAEDAVLGSHLTRI